VSSTVVRLLCFVGVLVLMRLWEHLAPFRDPQPHPYRRWGSHLGLVALSTLLSRLIPGLSAVAVASHSQWGLFHHVHLPFYAQVLLTIVILDLAVYGHHVLFHVYPPLWRIHQVHHADPILDTTTGVRFHPLEILLSMAWKMTVVALLGSPVLGVVIYEILLNATALFNHGNVSLPPTWESGIRAFLVTPDWHRLHHSVDIAETNSNYGSIFSLWDRLFGTGREQPQAAPRQMPLGLSSYRDPDRTSRLDWMLTLPFQSPLPEPEQGS